MLCFGSTTPVCIFHKLNTVTRPHNQQCHDAVDERFADSVTTAKSRPILFYIAYVMLSKSEEAKTRFDVYSHGQTYRFCASFTISTFSVRPRTATKVCSYKCGYRTACSLKAHPLVQSLSFVMQFQTVTRSLFRYARGMPKFFSN